MESNAMLAFSAPARWCCMLTHSKLLSMRIFIIIFLFHFLFFLFLSVLLYFSWTSLIRLPCNMAFSSSQVIHFNLIETLVSSYHNISVHVHLLLCSVQFFFILIALSRYFNVVRNGEQPASRCGSLNKCLETRFSFFILLVENPILLISTPHIEPITEQKQTQRRKHI